MVVTTRSAVPSIPAVIRQSLSLLAKIQLYFDYAKERVKKMVDSTIHYLKVGKLLL
jgi:hypothetical protein